MQSGSIARTILLFFTILFIIDCQIVRTTASNQANQTKQPTQANQTVYFTIVKNIQKVANANKILQQLAIPGFSRKHGYNYIAFDGWTCNGSHLNAVHVWKNINEYINDSIGANSSVSRLVLKQFFRNLGVKLLVNAFGENQNPASQGLDAINCSNQLQEFIKEYEFDGANIDFQDEQSFKKNLGITWLIRFSLNLNASKTAVFSHSMDVGLFDNSKTPFGDYSLVERAVGSKIAFYCIRYVGRNSSYATFDDIFMTGISSVQDLNRRRRIPIHKIVVGKPSLQDEEGYVSPNILLNYLKKAHKLLGWRAGVMFETFIPEMVKDETRFLTLRRDQIDPIKAVNMDSVNKWWPPEATASDIGVPTFAPNNMYNHFILGTFTCAHGAFDLAKIWSESDYYLSKTFGKDKNEIQLFLKEKFQKKDKMIVVRAFGNAESPTTANIKPQTCARQLSAFILDNNLDGTDINYKDNVAFNNNVGEAWLIDFITILRRLLPFHMISTTIQAYHLNSNRYPTGGFKEVILNIGDQLDFYNIAYFGQLNSNFMTYGQLFLESHPDNYQTSVQQLVQAGFQMDKIIIAKPLSDSELLEGFINPLFLRQIFLKASKQLQWKGGICYTNYIQDKIGHSLSLVFRGINKTDPIRFTYINNLNTWWPPTATLAEMGTPTFSKDLNYNYIAYAFWTCKQGPLAITKLYDDPIAFFGTELGKNKQQIQSYIKRLHVEGKVNLMVSAFGATQEPVKKGLDPIKCADSFLQYINENQLDGVDIDYQDTQSFKNGTGQAWLTVFMRQLRRYIPFHIITHAPQGPYFSPLFAETGAYLKVDQKVGKFIDFYNIQFYNQMNTTYGDYKQLFVDSGTLLPNTSIFQIIDLGIQHEKLVLGKPVAAKDAYNTGLVTPGDLNKWMCEAVKDKRNSAGWRPGVMSWNFLSDLESKFISEAMKKC